MNAAAGESFAVTAAMTGQSMDADTSCELVVTPLGARQSLEQAWRHLELQCSPSFFTSWAWIGAWLRALPAGTPIYQVSVLRDRALVASGLFCHRIVRRHGLRVRQLLLHECGVPALDALRIECNGLLVRPGAERLAIATLLNQIKHHPQLPRWDELVLPGLDDAPLWQAAARSAGLLSDAVVMPSRYTDLQALRAQHATYLDSLVSKTRRKIKTCIKEYEGRYGKLRCELSGSVSQALEDLSLLEELHQQYWISKGQPGSFANPEFRRFHRGLVEREHDAGGVRLLRIYAGEQTLGLLYVLIHAGKVSFYQCGYRYGLVDRHDVPGIVAIAVAIERLLQEPCTHFEFLAGRQQYKSELGTAQRERTWLVLQRPRLPLLVTRFFRRCNRLLRKFRR